MDDRQKIFNLIGLATKAGKTVSGEFMTEKSVKAGKASLVIVSEEASDNTRKMFTNMCTYYEVPIYFLGKMDELGHAMGKEMRAALAIVDHGFAKAVVKLMNTKVGSECEKDLSHLPVCAAERAQNGGKHESI
ncbi:50S ribosomal protein L7ae [Lacrimispora brassicae]